MYKDIPIPEKRLSSDSVRVWTISDLTSNVIVLIILGILLYLDYHFSWNEWVGWVLIGLTVLTIFDIIWSFYRPHLRYRYWGYGISQEFLQLKSGAFKQKYQLIPMTKIQTVSIHQGPLLRKYNLYNVTVNTIASEHVIPALNETMAMNLRNQISHYAKVKEADE